MAASKIGEIVKVSYVNKHNSQPATVIGVVEAVNAAQNITTVFVGGKQSWRVPTTSVAPLALPSSFSWTTEDTAKVRSTTAAFIVPVLPCVTPPPSTSPSAKSPQPDSGASLTTSATAAATKGDDDLSHASANPRSVSQASSHAHENYSFEPHASYTNILYELNARLTGLCTWSSPPLTALFLCVLYLWLAVEGSGVLSWSRTTHLLSAVSIAQRCLIAVARTLLAVVLCTCVSTAPRVVAASAFWLLFPLMVVSLGGVFPVRWWNALVVMCFPVCVPSQGGRGTPPAAAPLFLWFAKAVLDGVRSVLRGLSGAMIAFGESLRAVSEKSQ